MGRPKKKNKNKQNKAKQGNNKGNIDSSWNVEKAQRRRKKKERRREIAEQNFSKFAQQVLNLGLRIKEVKGDGNCLFRSVGDQIEGNQENHLFYRQAAIEYMVENEDHFKFFIEDDKSFEDYIKEMSKEGCWGGNLEIYALSMRFNVNFYIHIYNHPMYIVRNFAEPLKNIHLSYHDGSHYNSVRLQDDFLDDIPFDIPMEMIDKIETTTDMQAIREDLDSDEEEEENAESKENKQDNNFEKDFENIQNYLDYEDYALNSESEYNKVESTHNKSDDIMINGVVIREIKEIWSDTYKYNLKKSVITQDGIIFDEIKDYSKCHCNSNKKYRACCISDDLKGDFDKENTIFYCDLGVFKSRFHYEIRGKEEKMQDSGNTGNNSNSNANETDVNGLTKSMQRIFI